VSVVPSALADDLNGGDARIVNLHWVNGEMMSIADLGRLRGPLVWTLHDTWAFCGAEHYPSDSGDERFVAGYSRSSRRLGDRGLDIDRWTWRRKRRRWKRPMHIIAPSRWLAHNVARSALMRTWPVRVIPNALPTDVYQPWNRRFARDVLGLPGDSRLLLFSAVGGAEDRRKGSDLLVQAMEELGRSGMPYQAVAIGQSPPKHPPKMGLPVIYLGRLHDDPALALAYSACDVVIVPSRLDNLPQVGTEALACGTPVVAFNTAGMPDVVEHQVTGYLARAFDPSDLARGVRWVLEDLERYHGLRVSARRFALQNWSAEAVVPKYCAAYHELLRDA
jgi:glycosyltransferase involved in cell wall biosynthesis